MKILIARLTLASIVAPSAVAKTEISRAAQVEPDNSVICGHVVLDRSGSRIPGGDSAQLRPLRRRQLIAIQRACSLSNILVGIVLWRRHRAGERNVEFSTIQFRLPRLTSAQRPKKYKEARP
jgi:hypothetical protein